MKLISWNVNGLRACLTHDFAASFAALDADIFSVQETKMQPGQADFTEIYDRSQEKWCMLDPTTNGYLVDEKGTILSLLEARERMADTRFVTYCKATSREKDLQKLYRKNIARTAYYAKNLFRIQVDAVSQFGESGNWLNFPPEHFSIREWSVASAEYLQI